MISQNQISESLVYLAASIDSSIIGLGSSVSHLSHRRSPLTRSSQQSSTLTYGALSPISAICRHRPLSTHNRCTG
ncbi:hypothetical protein L2E82_25062 [Cichorium intybus]|uniref:Uncharacterized protein n=1 Tax=Cichorium intybus TaxID=13427 RepID=A0ACB9E371_CICIN|nr:hypothetical protein L2E82_25062 [Cichorium intybus]